MRNVRIWFTKLGQAKYISHLDINRCMTRAVRRAGIPLWYTNGFNPHPYMTFSLPLSLGVESFCESMDIRIDGDISNEKIKNDLNAVMPVGLNIVSVTDDMLPAGEIVYSQYKILLEVQGDVKEKINSAIESGELLAEKKSKSGRKKILKQVNLFEFIKEYSVKQNDNMIELIMILSAGIVKNVNPVLMVDTILKKTDINVISKSILREKLFTENMTEFH